MEFSEKLQELRKQKGLTQEELAKSLYVSRTAISKWESGRGCPNIDSLKEIAKFFSVTVDQLLSGEELLTIAQEDQKQKAGIDHRLGIGDLPEYQSKEKLHCHRNKGKIPAETDVPPGVSSHEDTESRYQDQSEKEV